MTAQKKVEAGVSFSVIAADSAADAHDALENVYARLTRASYFASKTERVADLHFIEGGRDICLLPLWSQGLSPFADRWTKLSTYLRSPDVDMSFWADWYEDRLAGRNTASLPDDLAEELDPKIARQDDEWWKRGPKEVNADIEGWVAELKRKASLRQNESDWDFFVSYSTTNEATAIDIGEVAESEHYSVFAQYKDMPTGSNFVVEMQNGLKNSSRMIALLTAKYLESDHCQAEWSAAYAEDPTGRRRQIVPFLLERTELPPLHKQIVYQPLYGLSREEARTKIIEALKPWEPPTKIQSRQRAAAMASPDPKIRDGKFTVETGEDVNEPFLSEELTKLPERLRRAIDALLQDLSLSNAPRCLSAALQNYKSELANGFQMDPTFLKDEMAVIEAEIGADEEKIWFSGGLEARFGTLRECHARISAHYPLDFNRDQHIFDAPIEPDNFDNSNLESNFKAFAQQSQFMREEGQATEEFQRLQERRLRQMRDIQSLPSTARVHTDDLFVGGDDRVLPSDVKKRFMWQTSGFFDKFIQRGANLSEISSSAPFHAATEAAKKILDSIWG